MRALIAALLLLATSLVQAQCTGALAAGTSVTAPQPLPGNALTTSVCIDVPAGAERLTVRLAGSNLAQDIDLLVRVDSPFFDPATESLGSLTIEELFERSHYLSASAAGDESLVLTRAGKFPLRAGRLHLALLNFSSQPAGFTISSIVGGANEFAPLDITFTDAGTANDSCNISGWTDPAPRSPVRGNSGTTLGEQRRIAMLEAGRLLAEQLRPTAPIRVQACWDDLEFDETGGVLAQAGPRFVVVDDPGRGLVSPYLDARHVLQFTPAASHQAGTSGCRFRGGSCTSPSADIGATFNLAVDVSSTASRRFDYGLTPPSFNSNTPSFVAVALHEISHGMGFIGLVGLGGDGEPLGRKVEVFDQTYDDAFGRFVKIIDPSQASTEVKSFLRVSEAERAAALASSSGLRFSSPMADTSFDNRLRDNLPPLNTVQLHAPLMVEPGSTYSHLGTQHTQQLMLATASSPMIRSLSLAGAMLNDIGFHTAARTPTVIPMPPDAQYFDVARNGHGIDFRRVAGTTDLYFLGFYSYDAAGNPEWYTSLGRVIDGVFVPQSNASGDSLLRFNYSAGPPPTSTADASPGFAGDVRVDFVEGRNSPICQTQAADRALDGPIALMNWSLNGETRQWCMQPLVSTTGVALDVSSVWFNPADPGWGITVQSFAGAGGDGIAIGVYYPDAAGRGRWGVVQSPTYVPNQTYTVQQVQGYCRGPQCTTPSNLTFTNIGTLRINLRPPSEGPSTLSLDVTYPGAGGGRFQRTDAPLTPANVPRYRGN
ncbi:MAG: hypothetical protein ACT4NL_12895 [Pseudomarimonas sp.]